MQPDVSVLIVNYNGQRFLDVLLDSLAHAFVRHSSEIVVVDNASSDGSAAWLRARADLRLVEPGWNTGFTGGCNLAARVARGRVLLLLNNDMVLNGALDELVDAALEPGVGAVGGRLQYGDGRLQYSIGLAHTPSRIALSWLGLERWPRAPALLRKVQTDPSVYDTAQADVDWVSGACLATRSDVWHALQGFDDRLFMYCEDVDYGRRVRRQGLAVQYRPTPGVTHFEAGGHAWVGSSALLRTARSYFIIVSSSHGEFAARLLSAALSLLFALRAGAFALLGCLAAAPRRALQFDKARGFARAAGSMTRACLTGVVPKLP